MFRFIPFLHVPLCTVSSRAMMLQSLELLSSVSVPCKIENDNNNNSSSSRRKKKRDDKN